MKKNISINIGGIIFHIEEDGYDILKNYLDTINRYFSNYEDSQDIISDIENRIAELFLSKLKEDKQVINKEDVEALMATLGSIDDFKTTEEDYYENEEEPANEKSKEDPYANRVYRHVNNKVIGGVASGIAHYFKIDALWIRLLFLLPLIDLFFTQILSTISIIAYLVCWIAIPSNPFLEDDKSVKKLYRSIDNKVLGGVSRGIATYFGVDVAIIRIIFILLLIPGFAGFFIYLVLWIITPAARTVTQKMQMEGTPITLNNIEKNIKAGLNVKEGEESTLVKILLFPFRLIAMLLNGIAQVLGPALNFILEAMRVVVGIILIISGLSTAISFVLTVFTVNGWILPLEYMSVMDVPWSLVQNTIEPIHWITASILFIIPPIFLMVAGISLIARKWVLNKTVGLSLLVIYVITIIISLFVIPKTILEFHEEGETVITNTYQPVGTPVFKVDRSKSLDYNNTEITFYGYEGSEIKVEKEFSAQGYSEENAAENALMVTHSTKVEADSVFLFDRGISFSDTAVFRVQRLQIDVNVPYGQEFILHESLLDNLRGTLYRNGYTTNEIYNYKWKFTQDSGLVCLTCPKNFGSRSEKSSFDMEENSYESNSFYDSPFNTDNFRLIERYNFANFDELDIATGVFAIVKQSDKYSVEVYAEDEEDVERLRLRESNNAIEIQFEGRNFSFWSFRKREIPEVMVLINLPQLKELRASTAGIVHLREFKANDLGLDISTAASVSLGGIFEEISAELSSAADLNARGTVNQLELEMSSAASVDAEELFAKSAYIDASSASKASVQVSDRLSGEVNSGANISYKGDPRLNVNVNSGGSVIKR